MNRQSDLSFSWPVFRLPFRPFFLVAAICGLFGVLLWSMVWFNFETLSPVKGMLWWHGHEMIFGFAGAVLVGFLLTAAKNWTGSEGIAGWRLIILVAFWSSARLGYLSSDEAVFMAGTAFEVAFWIYATYLFTQMIVAKKMWRNLVFGVILLSMGTLSLLSSEFIFTGFSFIHAFHLALILIAIAVTVISGRIIPFFTASATGTKKVDGLSVIELPTIGLSFAWFVFSIWHSPNEVSIIAGSGLCMLSLLHLARMIRWPIGLAIKNPMLWSLYLGYFFLVVGLFQISLFHFEVVRTFSAGFHTITIGAIGLLIYTMISRVSLGHTGRKIAAGKWLVCGFVLVSIAAVIRGVAFEFFPAEHVRLVYGVSSVLWTVAITIWLAKFVSVLTSEREDGKPG